MKGEAMMSSEMVLGAPIATCDIPMFEPWPKMARLSRDCIVTEKIDGTNAQIFISDSGDILTGSRNRWITPRDDNYGFAAWVERNREELLKLGPGRHFGEWWGLGIQRGYGLTEKRFSLFNAMRWHGAGREPMLFPSGPRGVATSTKEAPACCHVVPVLYFGKFDSVEIYANGIAPLIRRGSSAVPGYMNPEGIIVYHTAAGIGFKKTIENDNGKGAQ